VKCATTRGTRCADSRPLVNDLIYRSCRLT
jgi:hypothetical protein